MDRRTARATLVLLTALSVAPTPVTASTIEEIESEETLIVDGEFVEVEWIHDRFASAADQVEEWDEDDGRAWQAMLDAVAVLEYGSPKDKLALLSEVPQFAGPFDVLGWPPPDDPSGASRALDRLTAVFDAESDPWLRFLIARSLTWVEHPDVLAFFDALSSDPVPSLRSLAVDRFLNDLWEDDETDARIRTLAFDLWRTERTPWVRARLLGLFVELEDDRLSRECAELMDDDDVELAVAAVDCVGLLGDPERGRALARRAAGGADLAGQRALRSLRWGDPVRDDQTRATLESMWRAKPDDWVLADLMHVLGAAGSTEILDEARALSWSEDPDVATVALELLGEHRRPGDVAVLLDHAQNGEHTRGIALRALGNAPLTAEVEAVILQALNPTAPDSVRRDAARVLTGWGSEHFEDRKRFRPILAAVATDDPSEDIRTMAGLAAGTLDRRSVMTRIACSLSYPAVLDHALIPEADERSVRCHDRPGHEPVPAEAIRITTVPGGVERADRYDDGDREWFAVDAGTGGACWIPAERFRRVGPGEATPAASVVSSMELDVAIERTRTRGFLALEELGLVRRFDEGETLTGVRLTVDPAFDALGTAILRSLRE